MKDVVVVKFCGQTEHEEQERLGSVMTADEVVSAVAGSKLANSSPEEWHRVWVEWDDESGTKPLVSIYNYTSDVWDERYNFKTDDVLVVSGIRSGADYPAMYAEYVLKCDDDKKAVQGKEEWIRSQG